MCIVANALRLSLGMSSAARPCEKTEINISASTLSAACRPRLRVWREAAAAWRGVASPRPASSLARRGEASVATTAARAASRRLSAKGRSVVAPSPLVAVAPARRAYYALVDEIGFL